MRRVVRRDERLVQALSLHHLIQHEVSMGTLGQTAIQFTIDIINTDI